MATVCRTDCRQKQDPSQEATAVAWTGADGVTGEAGGEKGPDSGCGFKTDRGGPADGRDTGCERKRTAKGDLRFACVFTH